MKCRSGEAASVRAMCGIMAPDVTFIRFDFQGEPIASWRVQMWHLQKDSISSETIVLKNYFVSMPSSFCVSFPDSSLSVLFVERPWSV